LPVGRIERALCTPRITTSRYIHEYDAELKFSSFTRLSATLNMAHLASYLADARFKHPAADPVGHAERFVRNITVTPAGDRVRFELTSLS
jgi:hypothetical protein